MVSGENLEMKVEKKRKRIRENDKLVGHVCMIVVTWLIISTPVSCDVSYRKLP